MNGIYEFLSNDKNDLIMCNDIITYFEESNQRSLWQEDGFFAGRTISPSEIKDLELQRKIWGFLYKILEISSQKYGKIIYPEFWDIVYWPKGMDMDVHVDNGTDDLIQRHYTSVTYLNSDYSGGETFLPDFDYTCSPETGKTFMFPSNYYHGVKEVIDGDRYTLAVWYTEDPKFVMLPTNQFIDSGQKNEYNYDSKKHLRDLNSNDY